MSRRSAGVAQLGGCAACGLPPPWAGVWPGQVLPGQWQRCRTAACPQASRRPKPITRCSGTQPRVGGDARGGEAGAGWGEVYWPASGGCRALKALATLRLCFYSVRGEPPEASDGSPSTALSRPACVPAGRSGGDAIVGRRSDWNLNGSGRLSWWDWMRRVRQRGQSG